MRGRESESERQSESESDSENDSERESEMESESEIESESERDNACIGHHTSGQRMHWTPGNEKQTIEFDHARFKLARRILVKKRP